MHPKLIYVIVVSTIIVAFTTLAVLRSAAIIKMSWNPTEKTISPPYSITNWTVSNLEKDSNALTQLKRIDLLDKWSYNEKAKKLLEIYPVFDGHNDLAWNIRKILKNQLNDDFNFSSDLSLVEPWKSYSNSTKSHTDLVRLRKGCVGTQFWSAYIPCQDQNKNVVIQVLEQIDVIKRLIEKYPNYMTFCTTAKCVMKTSYNKAEGTGKIASLIGVEGGHLIHYSAAILRQLYDLGVRYLTLTHSCNTPWADSNIVDEDTGNYRPVNWGLSHWGLELIDEMNRLGMIVDLTHASKQTMIAVLKRSKAPVIFSHSAVKAVCNLYTNVDDQVLKLLKANGGVIMISFSGNEIYCTDNRQRATFIDVVKHIEHVRRIIGVNFVGVGGGFDGTEYTPLGLEDTSKYPRLFGELIRRGCSLTSVRKVSYLNILRVMENVENVKKELAEYKWIKPMERGISRRELEYKGFI